MRIIAIILAVLSAGLATLAIVTLLNQPTPFVLMRALPPIFGLVLSGVCGYGSFRIFRG